MKELILYGILNLGDLISTKIGLKYGMIEMNPLGRSKYMVLIKIIGTLIVIGLCYHMYKKYPSKIPLVKKVVYGLCIVLFLAIVNNVYWTLTLI